MLRNWKVYSANLFLILITLTISGFSLMWFHNMHIRFNAHTPFYFAQLVLFGFNGMILGFFDHFIYEVKKSGAWEIDVRKIIILGIPLGLVACSYLFYFSTKTPGLIHNLFAYVVNVESGQVIAAQIFLGYILITSFYKKLVRINY